jgi:hypothetical protein
MAQNGAHLNGGFESAREGALWVSKDENLVPLHSLSLGLLTAPLPCLGLVNSLLTDGNHPQLHLSSLAGLPDVLSLAHDR